MRDRWFGIVCALLSAALFGASTPFAKALLGAFDPWTLAGLLYLSSGVGLAIADALRAWKRRRTASEAPIRRRDWPWLVGMILTGGVIGPVLLMFGLADTPAASASLLLNLESVFTLAIAWLVFHENVDRRIFIGATAILAGAATLSWSGGPQGGGWAAAAIAGAGLAWAIDNNLTRKLSASDPITLAMVKGLVAGATNLAIAPGLLSQLPPSEMVVAAMAVGIVGYGLSLTLFVLALRHLGAARTGAYFAAAPFIGAAIAIAGFGDPLTIRFVIAAVLMAIGLGLHLAERHEHRHHHDPIRHDHRHIHDQHHQHTHSGKQGEEPHSHVHTHDALDHSHAHFPDLHHRHRHRQGTETR